MDTLFNLITQIDVYKVSCIIGAIGLSALSYAWYKNISRQVDKLDDVTDKN